MSAISIRNLSKNFGGLNAVDGVTFDVGEGERRIVIGPNGAGKTTLFHCITGTLQPTSGEVIAFDRDVSRLKEYERAELGMARTFQISNVFTDLTLVENVTLAILGTDRRKWLAHRTLDKLGDVRTRAIEGLARVGLEQRANEPVRRISYGERRQLELAIALSSDLSIILLDEPFAGLSQSERQRISQLIAELPRSITVLMIEHNMDVALPLADKVIVLHRGRVIVEGSASEVQANPDVREVYFGHA